MSITKQAENAEPRADLAVSQPGPQPAASLGYDETPAASRAEEQSTRPSALARNITGCQLLIENIDAKIVVARRRQEGGEVLALQKAKQNLLARKELLQRLYDNEARKGTL